MSSYLNKVVLAVSLLTLSSVSQASLITNGSFEQTSLLIKGEVHNTLLSAYEDKNSTWDIFYDLPGWTTTFGNGIELQKGVVTSSQDGQHHVELDSHMNGSSNSVMTQSLDSLTVGADYLLEFYYKPRTNTVNDNGINVYWYDTAVEFDWDMTAVYIADSTTKETKNWALQTVSFTALATSMDLSFASVGKQNTLGGLIDNVSLVQATSVPEPSTLGVFFAAAFGLFSMRRAK
ncbi:DUF642 domain-containing protein [uncultured Paraglaciecola sp.]|uniref:PEP-CTERM sorting domain-containing protein n=1 Tax=uncultured Paraglaciecola sp. TaxID=1765024 RepID=UPI00261B1ACD|nr:DUF642 domain-containing protein [uncultured Paraglaciecola sp.]